MKTLDEQIEYMRLQVAFNTAILAHRPSWKEEFEMSKAILDTLLQLKGKARDWNGCYHQWEEVDSQFSNEKTTAVKCAKCKCSGERNNNSAEVFWPAT